MQGFSEIIRMDIEHYVYLVARVIPLAASIARKIGQRMRDSVGRHRKNCICPPLDKDVSTDRQLIPLCYIRYSATQP
jgi:hypothetical protein